MHVMFTAILTSLLGLSASINGERLYVTIGADPPLSDPICVDKKITFTCHVRNADRLGHCEFQWSIDGDTAKIGNQSYALQIPLRSVINVTCEVYTSQDDNRAVQYGASTVIIHPNGTPPQVYFQYVTDNFVYELTGKPFNLTATVVSDLNLTSLYWSPPEHSGPLPNKTLTYHHGNITTVTFMLLKNATLSDSGNYTLTAVNNCGQNSSKVYVDVLTTCPKARFTEVQPQNFTAVEGYNTSLKCSFDGYYSPSSPIHVWVLLPDSQEPVWLNDQPYADCGCWAENKLACSDHTDPNNCCRFEFIIHSTPRLKDSGTVFSCTHNFINNNTAWMYVVPSPKVIEPPHNLSTTVGSTAVFTCDFEAATDNRISQIHWMFNGNDLAGCKRFQDRINCTVTQSSPDTNYISSTLEIYSVQADNAGQYTCYCSYDTNALNVDGVQVIQSDQKSATLSVQSDSLQEEKVNFIIIIGIIFGVVAIVLLLGSLIYCIRIHNKTHMGYISLEQTQSSEVEIKDKILDRYVMEELFPLWEKFGKALNLSSSFLENTYSNFPADAAERLRAILREWRDTTDHPSLSTLDKTLEQLGLVNSIPQ